MVLQQSPAKAPQLPREKVVELIVGMLNKQGEKMAAELERRIDAGLGLEVRGIKVDVSMLTQALDRYFEDHAEEATEPPSKRQAGPSSGARWMPGAPSATLMAAKALQECEKAEVFNRKLRVVEGAGPVPILSRPEMTSQPVGKALPEGEAFEVVARFSSQKDGRTYFRLKEAGWASSRSTADLTKVVLEPLPGEGALEPSILREVHDHQSSASKLLPLLDPETESTIAMPTVATAEGQDAAGGEKVAEEDVPEEPLAQEIHEADEGEEEEAPELDEECDADEAGAASSSAAPSRHVIKRFKVVLNRVPVVSAPGAAYLEGASHVRWLQGKEEFAADGVVFLPSEGRAYLRLRNGRGWVCEQSRNDLRRLAVVPVVRRAHPLSKKMARAVAFRGGDTDGMTKMGKEDLVRNRTGKIVSKKASEAAKKRFADSSVAVWVKAVQQARSEMGLAGFVPVKKGTPVYERVQAIYRAAIAGEGSKRDGS